MKIAVCDDCYEDALCLKNFLGGQEVGIYSGVGSLLMDVEDCYMRYDLYLLDIYMDETMNGIELAKRIRTQDEDAVICFISSSDDYYREAYDLYAVQYLLKPVREEEIRKLLERVSRSHVRRKEQSLRFKWRGQTGLIPCGRILFVSSREHTLSIWCKDGIVQECKGKLNEMAMQLGSDMFLRCHQSFLVNMYQVDNLSGNELMISGHRIPVSRRYYAEVKKRYQEILFEEVN